RRRHRWLFLQDLRPSSSAQEFPLRFTGRARLDRDLLQFFFTRDRHRRADHDAYSHSVHRSDRRSNVVASKLAGVETSLPNLLALLGWIFVFATTDWKIIAFGLGTLVLGFLCFLVWSRQTKQWPFAVKEVVPV